MTLVVNLFGGPGVSKSTTTALVFGKLKIRGVQAEIAPEYAKDLTWEERHNALQFQPYVAAKQMYRVHRLLGKVDVVITDSPILLSLVYKGNGYSSSFEAFLLDTFNGWETLNIELKRDSANHPYKLEGRSQSEEEARTVDAAIEDMLHHHGIAHSDVKVGPGEATAEQIVEMVLLRLAGQEPPVRIIRPLKPHKSIKDQMLEYRIQQMHGDWHNPHNRGCNFDPNPSHWSPDESTDRCRCPAPS